MQKKVFGLLSILAATALASCGGTTGTSTSSEFQSNNGDTPVISTPSEDSTEAPVSSTTDNSAGFKHVLEQLQNPEFCYKGTMNNTTNVTGYPEATQESSVDLISLISADHYYLYDSEYGTSDLYLGEDGKAVYKTLNPATNQLTETPATDANGDTIDFAMQFYNPFRYLSTSDMKLKDGTITVTLGSTMASVIATKLLGYSDLTLDTFTIEVDDDFNITKGTLSGTTVETTSLFGTPLEIVIDTDFEFTLTTLADEGILEAGTRDEAANKHEDLDELFTELKKGNYTATYTDLAIDEDIPSAQAKFTSKGIVYSDTSSTIGYYDTGEGVATFTESFSDNKIYADAAADPDLILSSIPSSFDYMSCMFDDITEEGVADKTYRLVNMSGLYDSNITDLLPFSPFYTEIANPGTLTITLSDDGTSCTIDYDYTALASDQSSTVTGKASVEITDIGTTEWPYSDDDFVPYVPNELETFLDNCGSNYTITGTLKEAVYGCTETEDGYYTADYDTVMYPEEQYGTFSVKVDSDTIITTEYDGMGSQTIAVQSDGAGNISLYQDTGTGLELVQTSEGELNQFIPLLGDMYLYASYFEANDQGIYESNNSNLAYMFLYALGFDDQDAGYVSVDPKNSSGNVIVEYPAYLDEEGTDVGWVEDTYSFIVSEIGTTVATINA